MKKEGRAGFIGFSSHKVPVSLKALRSGHVEVLMFPVNPAFDILPGDTDHEKITDILKEELPVNKERELLYLECQQKDIGFVAMKPYGGGRIFSLLKKFRDFTDTSEVVLQCLNYALTRPGVSTVVPGCKSIEEVKSALKYLDAPDERKDHSHLIKNLDLNFKGKCMYCNHCQPCPEGLDIAIITKLADTAEEDLTEALNEEYLLLENKASACKKCSICEQRCPFEVCVTANMDRAARIFKI